MSSDYLSLASLLLSIFAIGLSFYFWRNPIEHETKKIRYVEDKNNGIVYIVGIKHKEWFVKKILTDNIDKGEQYAYFANKKNNPTVNVAPKNLEELQVLIYE